MAEEQRNIVQQQAQAKAQMLRYEDELARKRMQVNSESSSVFSSNRIWNNRLDKLHVYLH